MGPLYAKIFINDLRTVLKIFARSDSTIGELKFSALCRAVQRRDQSVHKKLSHFYIQWIFTAGLF